MPDKTGSPIESFGDDNLFARASVLKFSQRIKEFNDK